MLHDNEVDEMITDRNATLPTEDTDLDDGNLFVLKKRYYKGHS